MIAQLVTIDAQPIVAGDLDAMPAADVQASMLAVGGNVPRPPATSSPSPS